MGNADGMSRRGKTGDDFKTPAPCVRAILDKVKIPKDARIIDPCRGSGVIGEVLFERGYKNVTEYDLEEGQDFHSEIRGFDYLIMNCPFSDKMNFHFKAFTVAKNIISILPQTVTSYNGFQSIFMDMPYFQGKYLMRPKFFMTPEDTESPKRGGVSAYSWFIWKVGALESSKGSFERYINLNNYFKGGEDDI